MERVFGLQPGPGEVLDRHRLPAVHAGLFPLLGHRETGGRKNLAGGSRLVAVKDIRGRINQYLVPVSPHE